jgi:hypothetical protein
MRYAAIGVFSALLVLPAMGLGPSGGAVRSDDPPPAAVASAQPHGNCVILKRMGPADQITSHMYSFGIRGKQFQYVEGELPPGVKFHGRLTDNDVRHIQSKGGHVVIMEPKYNDSDLREAKQSCREQ